MTETKFHKPPTSQTASQPNGSPTPSLDAREVKQVNTGQCDPWADHQPNAPIPGCVAPLSPGHDMGSQRLSLEDTEDGDAVDDIQPWEKELAPGEWFRTLVLELTTYTFEKFRIWKERLERISPIKDEISFSERFGPSFVQPATHTQTGDDRDDHVLEEKCQKRVPSQIFGLSESQKVKLFDVDIESQCIDQQALWFRIWSIVFPDTMEPQSWLLDRDPGLSISMMRDFWNSNGLKYIAQFLEDRRISQENSTKLTDMLYQRVLKDLLTGVMNERTCSWTALAPG
ncbi:hypothetical protein CEK26_011728 [Fusarium fujikuroi]|nr:hypothetical protein CEK27_011745 [Fusarium fujikuroi]QGI85008.1 hypothetical protein CEK25_011737 [Fusarium fujikuroi]QGI98659.1 hypothetical protein CEK26_011728 [Fusarium fujikuroi]